jgi:UDP-GlcNAc3NAcA epimerase
MKILTIIGARPQFIKASALSREFLRYPEINEMLLHTGQHFDENMSDIFFREMEIPEPKYNLNIHSLSHGAMTGQMLIGIEEVIQKEKPDFILVYGDTNSTLAGALAAKKLHIKVIHIEAGLRSFDLGMPEEINRILTDRISDLLFCPTTQAVSNLREEGIDKYPCSVILSGDVMYDSALYFSQKAEKQSDILRNLNIEREKYLLCTVHRAENTDDADNLREIISALNSLNRNYRIILPLHPRTRKIIESGKISLSFEPVPPAGYFDMLKLLRHSGMVLTDSGGLQKEAFFFDKFCVTLREQTEWVELVESGVNILAGADSSRILDAVASFSARSFPQKSDFYGDGRAGRKICEEIRKFNR